MNTAVGKVNGGRLTNAKRTVLIAKMFDALSSGYMTTNALSKQLQVSRPTIDSYRPLVDELIGKQKIERNVIRNLQLRRTYNIIEMLMEDLKRSTDDKVRQGYYNQIAKFSQHLALITGLNIETQVNVDQHQLVIIRADNNKRPQVSEPIEVDNVADIPVINEEAPVTVKQGHTISTDKG